MNMPLALLNRRKIGGFSPNVLFSLSETGLCLDHSDLNTLFQDSAGTTPVTTPGQTVGLALDKSKNLAIGPELVTNGDFSSGAAWSPAAGWAITGGQLVASAAVAFATTSQSVSLVAGRTYQVTYTVALASSGGVRIAFSGGTQVSGTSRTTAGTYTELLVAVTGNNAVLLQATGSGYTGTIDNITVRELAGNHAVQATAASRPLFAQIPSSGIRNVANGSAAVGDMAYWTNSVASNGITYTKVASGFDTDGLPYVDYSVVGTASANASPDLYIVLNSRNVAATGQTFTASIRAAVISGSAPTGSGVRVDVVGETAPSTVTETTFGTNYTSSTEGVASSSITLANAATNQIRTRVIVLVASGQTANFTVRIKALQLERGAARTAYQFNYAKFNIVEPPFAQLNALLFDGVDDFLATPAIDFSATDEVTVVAGVRKLSDAAQGILVELTTSAGINAGSFNVQAPGVSPAQYRAVSGGSGVGAGNASISAGYAAPLTNVVSAQFDISGDSLNLRLNGSLVSNSTGDQGTGNFSNAIVYIGRRGGTSLPFNGYLFSLIIRGKLSSADTLTQTERWVGTKTGIAL